MRIGAWLVSSHAGVIRCYIDGTEAYQIDEVTEERDLGVVFTCDLKFHKHINSVIKGQLQWKNNLCSYGSLLII